MERNLIYLNNCAVLPGGKVNSFLMQEVKWLTGHFERAFVVSHSGFGWHEPGWINCGRG